MTKLGNEISSAILQDKANSVAKFLHLTKYPHIQVKDVAKGKARRRTCKITIPKWLMGRNHYYISYYVIHEVCHFHPDAIGYGHGPRFKKVEKIALANFGLSIKYKKAYPKAVYNTEGVKLCGGYGEEVKAEKNVKRIEKITRTREERKMSKKKKSKDKKKKVNKSVDKMMKKKNSKKSSKKIDKNAPSIRGSLYDLFESEGCENVTVEEATKLAKKCKKNTKFNKWHLYFHRKNWRAEKLSESRKARTSGKDK